jgi:hypothetical protein
VDGHRSREGRCQPAHRRTTLGAPQTHPAEEAELIDGTWPQLESTFVPVEVTGHSDQHAIPALLPQGGHQASAVQIHEQHADAIPGFLGQEVFRMQVGVDQSGVEGLPHHTTRLLYGMPVQVGMGGQKIREHTGIGHQGCHQTQANDDSPAPDHGRYRLDGGDPAPDQLREQGQLGKGATRAQVAIS